MNKNEKIELLRLRLSELRYFESNLSNDNINDFRKLRISISELLDDNEKLRFNKIVFYTEAGVLFDFENDDLPF